MGDFVCDICSKAFNRKAHLEYHVSREVCTAVGKEKYKCKFCDKGFTTSTSMYRHMKHTCGVKKDEDSKRDEIFERLLELEKKNERLEKEVVTLRKTVKKASTKPNITNNNTQNINNGIVANINLIGYGKEDLSKIDKKEILKAINAGFDSTVKLTETLHFNPKYPEYHNVYITNVKDKYAMKFDGKEWNLTMKDDLINTIYDDKKNYIEENMDEFIESLSLSKRQALKRWLDTDDENERISKIKSDIKLLLYNKRNIVLDKHQVNTVVKTIKQSNKSKSRKVTKDDISDDDS
ncbi:hypothetical protein YASMINEVIRUS_10 [Yasminevirus sp. GU-2018]|uniref:C2H2-type domain-containing protein n=1 Tax=Yasminevirus sp. GU-2018 TaxID=2420051 RepID=A0A5K0U6I5_9VIRU|nr:hypothetical protein YASMINEVIRUS_10 [Yasminevirus sp. GU-2018]